MRVMMTYELFNMWQNLGKIYVPLFHFIFIYFINVLLYLYIYLFTRFLFIILIILFYNCPKEEF